MVRLGGLWKNVDRDGVEFLSGNLGNGRMIVLPNKHKTRENDPDFILYVREKQENPNV